MMTFNDLPNEIKLLILKANDPKQLSKLREINSEFKILCESNLLWKDFVIKKFGYVDDNGEQLIPEMINNSWYNTYIYLSRNSKLYVLTETDGYGDNMIGIYKSFRLAFNSLLNYIIDNTIYRHNFKFANIFFKNYPEFGGYCYLSDRDELPDDYEIYKRKIRLAVSDYLKKKNYSEDGDGEYKLSNDCRFRICVTHISYN